MFAGKTTKALCMGVVALVMLLNSPAYAGEGNKGRKQGRTVRPSPAVTVRGRTVEQPSSRVFAPRSQQRKPEVRSGSRDRDSDRRHDRSADRGHHRDGHYDRDHSNWLTLSLQRPLSGRRWVPGHYENRAEEVLVCEGRYEKRLVRPAKTWVYYDERGRRHTVEEPAQYETVWIPPVYETRIVRVYVPGYYEETACRTGLSASFTWKW